MISSRFKIKYPLKTFSETKTSTTKKLGFTLWTIIISSTSHSLSALISYSSKLFSVCLFISVKASWGRDISVFPSAWDIKFISYMTYAWDITYIIYIGTEENHFLKCTSKWWHWSHIIAGDWLIFSSAWLNFLPSIYITFVYYKTAILYHSLILLLQKHSVGEKEMLGRGWCWQGEDWLLQNNYTIVATTPFTHLTKVLIKVNIIIKYVIVNSKHFCF